MFGSARRRQSACVNVRAKISLEIENKGGSVISAADELDERRMCHSLSAGTQRVQESLKKKVFELNRAVVVERPEFDVPFFQHSFAENFVVAGNCRFLGAVV